MSSEIQNLEKFIFAKDPGDFIGTLVPGTDVHYYYTCLSKLQKNEKLSEEDISIITKYTEKFKSEKSKAIKVSALVRQLESASTPEETKKLCLELNACTHNFLFDHQQPSSVSASNLAQEKSSTFNSLEEAGVQINAKAALEEYYAKKIDISKLSESTLARVDLQKALELKVEDLQYVLNTLKDLGNYDNLHKILSQLRAKRLETNKSYEFPEAFFKKMTLTQMLQLKGSVPDVSQSKAYVGRLFAKTFKINKEMAASKSSEGSTLKEKHEILKKMYDWAVLNAPSFLSLRDQLLFAILLNGLQMEVYDKKLFKEYLGSPKSVHTYLSESSRKFQQAKSYTYDNYWHNVHRMYSSDWISDEDLVERYLEVLFQNEKDYQEYLDHLKEPILKKIFYRTKLYNGESFENISELLGDSALRELQSASEITLKKSNKTIFRQNESVKLLLDIKNIESLIVRVFEIDTESYFKKTLAPIDNGINLDGLIPQQEDIISFSEPPIRRFTKEFSFDDISKKPMGYFVVEFIGGGMASRAVIKKGFLSYISHTTIHGHVFEILDENQKVVKSPNTGIFIEKNHYSADKEGRVLIPYNASRKNSKAVLLHENYAELTEILLLDEKYEFNCALIYDNETLLMGSQASFVLQPRLFLNDAIVNPGLVRDLMAEITSVNDMNVSASQKYENLVASQEKDITLSYPIPGKLKKLSLSVSGSVKLRDGKDFPVKSEHQILINTHTDDDVLHSLHLRLSNEGYTLHVLGRNGEPLKGGALSLNLNSMYRSTEYRATLHTNEEGFVRLGKLTGVSNVSASLQASVEVRPTTRSWNITQSGGYQMSKVVNICEGEDAFLPHLDPDHEYRIVEVSTEDGELIEDRSRSLVFNEAKRQLEFKKPAVGRYFLDYVTLGERVEINVVKGTHWGGHGNYIQLENSIICFKDTQVFMNIGEIHHDSKTKETQIKVESQHPQSTKVHVFAFQFLPTDAEDKITQTCKNVKKRIKDVHRFNVANNAFLSNKRLNEEITYIINRKSSARLVGNTLEKPVMVLKRKLVRETNTGIENLDKGTGFKQQDQVKVNFEGERAIREDLSAVGGKGSRGAYSQFMYLLNFLANPTAVHLNLSPDEHGIVKFPQLSSEKYAVMQIILTNNYGAVQTTVPVSEEGAVKIPRKDMRLKDMKSSGKSYQDSRRGHPLTKKGETLILKDMTSTEMAVVDNLKKMVSLLRIFSKYTGKAVTDEQMGELEQLVDWMKLPEAEKLKIYDKFASHELNLYIFFKDNAFFDVYIRPFIENKIEKSFVDFFLLDKKEELKKYLRVPKFNQLNALEVCLLVYRMSKTSRKECEEIVSWAENQNKLNVIPDSLQKKYFDTVLNDKSIAGGPSASQTVKIAKSIERRSESPQLFEAMFSKRESSPIAMAAPRMMMKSMAAPVYELEEDINFGSNDIFGDESKGIVEGFKNLDKTKEYVERQYMYQKYKTETKSFASLNQFFVDYMQFLLSTEEEHLPETAAAPFLSTNFIYSANSFTEIAAALTLTDLPAENEAHEYTAHEGIGLKITAGSEALVFTKELVESSSEDLKLDIMIIQRFMDPKDRYETLEDLNSVKVEKKVEEYLVGKVYGSQVIVSNSTVSSHEVQVVTEVPQGAVPVKTLDYTKAHNLVLEPYKTTTIEFFFYFPEVGKFEHYPSTVAKDGRIIATAAAEKFEVLREKKKVNLDRIEDILSHGSKKDILNFMTNKNIQNQSIFRFQDIYWLLRQEDFFKGVLEILRNKRIFEKTVWSYAYLHGNLEALRELLAEVSEDSVFSKGIHFLRSPLVEIDTFSVYEYHPMVNSRVHKLTDSHSNILNQQLRERYLGFLLYLSEKGRLDAREKLVMTYYLLLQDRIEEAIQVFSTISKEDVASVEYKIQYDYFEAYLDFFNGFPSFARAREIVIKYLAYPVISWRNLFIDLANQLAEYDGEDLSGSENPEAALKSESEQAKNKENAGKAEMLGMELEGTQIKLTVQNVDSIQIGIYKIDLEVLFSRNPFLLQGIEDFGHVQPNMVILEKIEKTSSVQTLKVDLPEAYHKTNVFIQAKTQSKIQSATYFSTSLKVQIDEAGGQVKVMDEALKPISKIYVKAYSKSKRGAVSFYKDGYTDIRGTFDYSALSTSTNMGDVLKFSLLVMSDELGSLIKETDPPASQGKTEGKILDIKFNRYLANQMNSMQVQSMNYQNINKVMKKKK